jgi:hypothetical protein
MTNPQNTNNAVNNFLDFLNAPEDENIIYMDCSDCDKLAGLAERVAAGVPVAQVLPALNEHLKYWKDCREEFEALVAVLKAESNGNLNDALDELAEAFRNQNN